MLNAHPSPVVEADDSAARARVLFNRVLASWAIDLLDLRRRGLDKPGSRPGRGIFAADEPAPAARPDARAPIARARLGPNPGRPGPRRF